MLRSQFGPQVDPREAYVDALLVNVYGGPGTTSVWLDDLEIVGVVSPTGVQDATAAHPTALPPTQAAAVPTAVPKVELRRLLEVGGRPFFPRIIQHRGEPLERLQALGFNCVRIAEPPTAELLSDAARLGLWLIAPPPPVTALKPLDDRSGAATIPATLDPVLAWDLGSNLSHRDLKETERWAERVQWADPRGRPIVCHAIDDLENYTRPPFNVLLLRRDTLGSSFELSLYSKWVTEQTQLARAARRCGPRFPASHPPSSSVKCNSWPADRCSSPPGRKRNCGP